MLLRSGTGSCRLQTKEWMIEQIPQLGDETGARSHSAWVGYTLYFANIQEITNKKKTVS
jgi:hypothetical protein